MFNTFWIFFKQNFQVLYFIYICTFFFLLFPILILYRSTPILLFFYYSLHKNLFTFWKKVIYIQSIVYYLFLNWFLKSPLNVFLQLHDAVITPNLD